jgi:hypothetical protein
MPAAQPWKWTTVPSFEGGINRDWAPDALKPNQHRSMRNLDPFQRGVKKRPGTTRLTSSALVSATEEIKSLYRYAKNNGTRYFLAQSQDSVFTVSLTSGTAVEIASGLPEVAANWLTYNDLAYLFNSDESDTGFHKYDGTTFTKNISGGAIPAKGFTGGVIHVDLLFAWGDADNPSRLYFSDAYDPETFTSGNFIRFRENDGDQIRGAVPIAGGHLLVLKDTSTWVLQGYSDETFQKQMINGEVGLIGDTLQAVDGRPIWLSTLGVCWYNPYSGTQPFRIISEDKINQELREYDRDVLATAIGRFFPKENKYLLSLPDAATPITYAFHLSVVSYTQDGKPFKQFPITDYSGLTITAMESVRASGDDGSLYYGEASGQISKSDPDVFTDNGVAIEIEYLSPFYDFGLPDFRKRLRRVTVPVGLVGDTANTLTLRVNKDWEDSDTVTQGALAGGDVMVWGVSLWGDAAWGSEEVVNNIRFPMHFIGFNKVALKITKSSDGRFIMHPYTMMWMPKDARRWAAQV